MLIPSDAGTCQGFMPVQSSQREYLLGYTSDANWETYDLDMQMTKDHVERILENGYIEDIEINFLESLIPDIENNRIRTELEEYLDSIKAL